MNTMLRFERLAALGAMAGLVMGMSCAGGTAAPGAGPALDPQTVTIDLVNDMFYDARVRASYIGGHRYPMGTVPSYESLDSLTIPWSPHPLTFEIDVIVGPGAYLTEEIQVEPGEYLELRLPANIGGSTFFRRVGMP